MCVPKAQRMSSSEEVTVHRHHFSTERKPTSLANKNILAEHCANTNMRVGMCWRSRKEKHRETNQHSWMAAIHAVRPNFNRHSRWQHIHIHKNKILKTRRQGVAVCVALRVSASPDRNKTKQEGNKCVLRPTGPRRTPTRHGSLSAPFVAAPPHACSRRGAQGRRNERVGGCASGAVGRETHGTPHRKSAAETIKEGRVEKKKECT
ncbi:hypothetical protein TCDM_13104 [Trypanosoma cruzi Dm28c]|uniref:Uncharacterized protein n=1 Tax=Trypanosoma cruzi Dm28c TaxID=1416333 RepID=V5ATJ1_TRYCR|nr:hypothetical protein TCDM_13104 [Trypanosoma cruzi Dm28c]